MTTLTLTLIEVGIIVFVAVTLAVTDGAAISRLGVTYAAKYLGIKPNEINQYSAAADGDSNNSEA